MISDLTKKVSLNNHLWLEWKKVTHKGNGVIELLNPKFTGPVLTDCEPLEVSDTIKLDLTHHFLLQLPRPYMVDLKWNKLVSQDTKEATFDLMTIQDTGLGKLSLLKDNDKIFINCKDQNTEAQMKGIFKVGFEIMVFNSYNEPYDLSK